MDEEKTYAGCTFEQSGRYIISVPVNPAPEVRRSFCCRLFCCRSTSVHPVAATLVSGETPIPVAEADFPELV